MRHFFYGKQAFTETQQYHRTNDEKMVTDCDSTIGWGQTIHKHCSVEIVQQSERHVATAEKDEVVVKCFTLYLHQI